MFRAPKSRDVITLFHRPSSQASTRVLTLLKQASAAASESATGDQASDHTAQNEAQRAEFDLNITEDPPTSDQLKTIFDYFGGSPGQLVKGAGSREDALKRFSESKDSLQRPIIVDWMNGKAVAGENKSEILNLLGKAKKASQD